MQAMLDTVVCAPCSSLPAACAQGSLWENRALLHEGSRMDGATNYKSMVRRGILQSKPDEGIDRLLAA